MLADPGVLEDVEALGVGGHQAVLDSVMNHLDEVPRAAGPAVEVALPGSTGPSSSRRAECGPHPGGQRCEDRVEVAHDVRLAADHQAVAALPAPDAAAGADVDVMDPPPLQRLGTAD